MEPRPTRGSRNGKIGSIWGIFAGGCNLNRKPDALVAEAGFQIQAIDRHYAPGVPKIAGFVSAGVAPR